MSLDTITLRILGFHNCEGCIRKVGMVLHQLDGVEPVEFDPMSGKITISTSKHPDVIKDVMERRTKKKVLILSHEINPGNQSNINVQDLAETLLRRLSQAEGLNNVELVGDLNSNSFRLSFNHRLPDFSSIAYIADSDNELFPHAMRTTLESSAPQSFRATADQVPVYGYPSQFYGITNTI
ncbi:Heavy metal-associated domain, HMA [Artemisia annua]|uniref:Heavy metal-associated domain, HMA n=1 Tax=Artemisia annua TaxID=35608 RepID=A0A2U1Q5E2_ARTAN|nr:Heavy metal-associated domain, HMA [Artemisia annua]